MSIYKNDDAAKKLQQIAKQAALGGCFLSSESLANTRRLNPESGHSFRSAFALDRDRILYSGAYRRYQGKTQVFSFTNFFDEEMSNRSLHTTYVSQIARTIAKMLGLDQEMVEAISLGHDLGHTPFGHAGEKALCACSKKYGVGAFHHNIQSLRVVDKIAKKGQGLNLSFAVRDGIISHDGEVHSQIISPQEQKSEQDLQDYITAKKKGEACQMMPATMEGCVVRMADTIAYIGQDVEDAIRLGLIDRQDLPAEVVQNLGSTNSQIVDTLIKSVVLGSWKKKFVAFAGDTADYLKILKDFNYQNIYLRSDNDLQAKIDLGVKLLFEKYYQDLQNQKKESKIFEHFLNSKGENYLSSVRSKQDAQIVVDFMATMTDRYFNQELKNYLVLQD